VDGPSFRVTGADGRVIERTLPYHGNVVPIFRLAIGADRVYASTVLPIHFLCFDEARRALDDLGYLGNGEIYSFAAQGTRLFAAAYAASAPLFSFDTSRPFQPGVNPTAVRYQGMNTGWRPLALVPGPDGKVYGAAIATYGQLSGPLISWDTAANRVEQTEPVIPDQGISTLAAWKDYLIGGTTVAGGGGSHPTHKEARLFMWDPRTRRVIFQTVPLPGVETLNDFVLAPNGLLYGIGDRSFFVFNPNTHAVEARGDLPVHSPTYNAAAIGPDGRIWALAVDGIFTIDPATKRAEIAAIPPVTITAGFALRGRAIYFAHGADLYCYHLPLKN
jgi:hypothetical protein